MLRRAMVPAPLWPDTERRGVCGNSDDGLGDVLAEVSLGGLLPLSEDHNGDFFQRLG